MNIVEGVSNGRRVLYSKKVCLLLKNNYQYSSRSRSTVEPLVGLVHFDPASHGFLPPQDPSDNLVMEDKHILSSENKNNNVCGSCSLTQLHSTL